MRPDKWPDYGKAEDLETAQVIRVPNNGRDVTFAGIEGQLLLTSDMGNPSHWIQR